MVKQVVTWGQTMYERSHTRCLRFEPMFRAMGLVLALTKTNLLVGSSDSSTTVNYCVSIFLQHLLLVCSTEICKLQHCNVLKQSILCKPSQTLLTVATALLNRASVHENTCIRKHVRTCWFAFHQRLQEWNGWIILGLITASHAVLLSCTHLSSPIFCLATSLRRRLAACILADCCLHFDMVLNSVVHKQNISWPG